MKKLRLWVVTLLLVSTLFIAIAQLRANPKGQADSDRPSVNTNGMVRLIYFLPSDRPARPDRVAALRQLIKDAQQLFADEMNRHGWGEKTFTVETDVDGEPLVHQINGKFKEDYYFQTASLWKVWAELPEHFEGDDFQHVYFIAIDFSNEGLEGGEVGGLASLVFYPRGGRGRFNFRGPEIITQGEEVFGGLALIPSFGHNFDPLFLTAHEIGHAFGLVHDFRKGRNSNYVMGFGSANRLSKCAAEWLSVSRFFNTKSIFRNEPGEIQLLSLRALSRDAISFRFKVTDSDGLHQAQLLVPEIWEGSVETTFQLFDCKRLNGKTATVEAVVSRSELVDRIALQIIDVEGNITWATFLIELDEVVSAQNALDVNSDGVVNISDLAPFASRFGQSGRDPADVNGDGVVNIVDVLLVAASISSLPRQVVETFTAADVQKWLTDAKQLEVENKILKEGIVRLEHLLAVLTAVVVDIPGANLRAAAETAIGVASGTPIFSSEMETLTRLEAGNANISDLTGLEHATNLTWLGLWVNNISDPAPVGGLTDLTYLNLAENSISDISALVNLTNLTHLELPFNSISDISPLVANTGLGNGDEVDVRGNPLSYQSIHTHIPALQRRRVTVEFDADGTRPPDVNGDGSVNVLDLLVIVSKFGDTGTHIATDISGDGVVDILDLVLVAGMFEDVATAPSAQPQAPETLTAVEVQGWLTDALSLEVRDPIMQRGIMILEQLLVSLIPTETELLTNYPNPFNPETWIPYRLAEDAFVTLTIYDLSGQVIRTLDVGHRIASVYESRSKAVHWDGRNDLGEQVVSGVYFYTLTAGDFSATRKMFILK